MKLSFNVQSAIQNNLSVSLVSPTSPQEAAATLTIKVQPLQRGIVQVVRALHTTSLAPPDDFLENPITYRASSKMFQFEVCAYLLKAGSKISDFEPGRVIEQTSKAKIVFLRN